MRVFRLIAVFVLFATGAAACPDHDLWGTEYNYSGKDLFSGKRFSVIAGGTNEIQSECKSAVYNKLLTDRGPGYFTTAPDFTFQVSGMQKYELEISVSSEACDPVVLVSTGAASWFYDDDDGPGDDARIYLRNPSNGYLDVWVGAYSPSDGNCNAILKLESF